MNLIKLDDHIKYILNTVISDRNQTHCILTPSLDVSREVNNTIIKYYNELPDWLKLKKVNQSLRAVSFNNGCKFLIFNNPITLKGFTLKTLAYFDNDGINQFEKVIERDAFIKDVIRLKM